MFIFTKRGGGRVSGVLHHHAKEASKFGVSALPHHHVFLSTPTLQAHPLYFRYSSFSFACSLLVFSFFALDHKATNRSTQSQPPSIISTQSTMSLSINKILAASPNTERGRPTQLSTDPKGERIAYAVSCALLGTCVLKGLLIDNWGSLVNPSSFGLSTTPHPANNTSPTLRRPPLRDFPRPDIMLHLEMCLDQ